jgi:hypothetical protein
MNFNNLTNEQVVWLEQKIKQAYNEGLSDSRYGISDEDWTDEDDWLMSLAKNQTCHILAERFMKSVEDLYEN